MHDRPGWPWISQSENLKQTSFVSICILGVLIFTIISMFRPSDDIVMSPNFINLADVDAVDPESVCDPNDKVIDCRDPEVFHSMIKVAIERFRDVHFYRFAKAVRGSNDSSCHMAWRFRPVNGNPNAFYKDYREFVVSKSDNCSYNIVGVGDYHSGTNVRKITKPKKDEFIKLPLLNEEHQAIRIPVNEKMANDTIPVVKSEKDFVKKNYLMYTDGGDRCESMDKYLSGFACMLAEARYLKRTLVMDMNLCLPSIYTSSGQSEEGKDFRFYFDLEHLKNSTSVLEQTEFWSKWEHLYEKNALQIHVVEDLKVTPMKLKKVKKTLIMRKFTNVGPDNSWYKVCEGETVSVVHKPWHMIWKSKRLMEIVLAIVSKLNFDFDSIHVIRDEKAKNKALWPHLNFDTSPESILSKIKGKIKEGRDLYISTNEPNISMFDPLKEKYKVHFIDDYKALWDGNSDWYIQTMRLNQKVAVEFDDYMKTSVDREVFLRGRTDIQTFNDLTSDCENGVNSCPLTN